MIMSFVQVYVPKSFTAGKIYENNNLMLGGVTVEKVMSVASYVYNRYRETYGQRIDEMKLHKMMYFAQRESIIQTDQALFDATFYGWKYGPVLKDLRNAYRDDSFMLSIPDDVVLRIKPIIDKVFEDYASKSSWSLSRLTHGEISWKNSRLGVPQNANSDNAISLEDIRLDAARAKDRREMLNHFGLL